MHVFAHKHPFAGDTGGGRGGGGAACKRLALASVGVACLEGVEVLVVDIENAGGGGAGSRADSLGAHGDLSTTRQNRARAVASAPRSIGADVIPTQARRQGAG